MTRRAARARLTKGTAPILALALALSCPAPGAAEPAPDPPGHLCAEGGHLVFAADPATASRVCDVAAAADPLLSGCGLPDYGPVTFYVTRRIVGAGGHCLGTFVTETNEIAVLHPSVLADADSPDAIFGSIAPDALFDSLVVHELAHARLSNLAGCEDIGVANHEYIAYAMQLASLPTVERNAFLDGFSETVADTTAINAVILSFAPALFVKRVWAHFDAEENGCGFVGALLDRRVSLELPDL